MAEKSETIRNSLDRSLSDLESVEVVQANTSTPFLPPSNLLIPGGSAHVLMRTLILQRKSEKTDALSADLRITPLLGVENPFQLSECV